MNDDRPPARVEVVISGPGHHDRAARAQPVITAVAALGLDVMVTTDLRPRLADDIRAMLDAGATSVRLEADGLVGDLTRPAEESPDRAGRRDGPAEPVMIILAAGADSTVVVRGEGESAAAIRLAIDATSQSAGRG